MNKLEGHRRLEGRWWKLNATTPIVIAGAGSPIHIKPGTIFNDAIRPVPSSGPFVEVDPAVEVHDPSLRRLGILRPGELGDVLVALEACRILKRLFATRDVVVTLYTHTRFHRVCKCQGEVPVEGTKPPVKPGSMTLDFTSYFELDHIAGNAHVSRLDRVLQTFGVVI